MNITIGTIINERYKILEALGGGGQGFVFRVCDLLENGSEKALKLLSASGSDSMFRFEFEQAKQLVHPGLARVFDLGRVSRMDCVDGRAQGSGDGGAHLCVRPEAEGAPVETALGALFFTQEFVSGAPSHIWMRTEEAQRDVIAHAGRIGLSCAQCLSLIHHAGLLHRDIKPSNILVGEGGRSIKLIDFGSAAAKNAWDGLRAGTSGYAPKEAFYGYPDERSDIYSLGVTLAELVSGKRPRAFFPPFTDGFLKRLLAQTDGNALCEIIERMIAREPEHRFQTAEEAAEALAEALGVIGKERHYVDEVKDKAVRQIRTAQARAPRLSGRAAEMGALLDLFEQARLGKVKTAILKGAPGVGKTRLFQAAVSTFQLQAAKRNLEPPEFHTGSLRELLRVIHSEDRPGSLLTMWIEGAHTAEAATHPGNEDALIVEMTDAFLGITRPTVILSDGDDRRMSALLLRSLAGLPTKSGAMLAVVAEIDELPSDENTKQESVAFDTEILQIFVYPLGLDEETDMIAQILGGPVSTEPASALRAELASKIHEQTGGIPLVTEALFSTLFASSQSRAIAPSDINALFVESSPLDRAVKCFLDGLDVDTRDAVETAAVIGEPVSVEDLLWVLFGEEGAKTHGMQLSACIATLARNGWTRLDNGLISLRPAVRDRIAAALDSVRIVKLHQRALSLLDRNRLGKPWQIAEHAFSCGDSVRAKKASVSAYEVFSSTGDLGGAASYLCRALKLHAFPENEEGPMRVRLAELYRQTGRYEDALKTAEGAAAMGGQTFDRAALERASALRMLGRTDEARAVLETLFQSEDISIRTRALSAAARMDYDRGDMSGALSRISPISADELPKDGRLEVLGTIGLVALTASDTTKAEDVFKRGLIEAKAACDMRSIARFHGLLGMLRHRAENYQEAAVHCAEAAAFADKCGDRHAAATYLINLAAANTELGHFQEALDAYREGLTRLRRFGRRKETALSGSNFAEILFRLGDLVGAEAASSAAVEDMRNFGAASVPSVLLVRAEILLALKRMDEAEALLLEAESVSESQQNKTELAISRLRLATCALERGNFNEARQRLSDAKAADCDASSMSKIEVRRLSLQLAQATEGDIAAALLELMSVLPSNDADLRDDHLFALVTAATAAHCIGRRDISERAAGFAIAVSAAVHRKTPSLYRKSEPAYVKEMNMILGLEKESASPKKISGWEHLVRINTRLNSEFRVGRLLEMIMDAALDIARAERGFLLIAKPDGELKVRCARNMDKESLSLDESNYSRSAAKKAFESKEPLLTADAGEDTRFHEMKSVVNLKLRYIIAVPLLVGGKAKGAVYLDSRQAGRFDESTLTLLEALADQAAIALTNARLKTEIEQRQIRIEKLNRELSRLLEQREVELREVKGALEKQTSALIGNYRYEEIIARSKPMTEVFRLLDRVTAADFPVIIQGESGTGKELAARAIHFNSTRRKKPFVAENCAAIPETLMESVLFGHVKGAFTGATSESRGLFVEADGGTLFLDEISELSLSMQAKLLRVLQNSEVRPLGGAKTKTVNVRVLAATNRDLKQRVKEGAFREDLYYRLNVIEITLPPLRERREDILLLAEHFIAKHSDQKKRITKNAAQILLDYPWPGNVRRLENEMVRAAILSDDEITPEHLSPEILTGISRVSDDELDFDVTRQVDKLKKRLLAAALAKCKGNQTAASEMLGVSRFGLQKMMKRLGV